MTWDLLPSKLSPIIGKAQTMLRSTASKFSEVRNKKLKSLNNAEIYCFQIFMVSQQKMIKPEQCWDGPPSNLSPRRALDPSWILVFLSGVWLEIQAFLSLKKKECEQCWDLLLPHYAKLRTKIWKRPYNAEMSCFQVFHRFAPKCRKVWKMLRSAAAKFAIGPCVKHR